MNKATKFQIEQFRSQYCTSHAKRISIINHFNVEIESYEELLPGKVMISYATGNREIKNAFVIFKVIDTKLDIEYYPVFSETVGRVLANNWNLKLPIKMTVFSKQSSASGSGSKVTSSKNASTDKRKEDNQKMLLLIQIVRSMMILHVNEPDPMRNPFKQIYLKLLNNPNLAVLESDIKSINTATLHYLNNSINTENENFKNLTEYINYLKKNYPSRHLRNFDFKILRDKMASKYPNEEILF